VGYDACVATPYDRSTADLVRGAQQGEASALEELVLRHMPALRAYVRLRAGPELRAQESTSDLVQSTCRELCQSLDNLEFRDEDAFRGWLFTLAWKKILARRRYYRAARRDPRAEQSLELTPELAEELYAATLSPSNRASVREEAAILERAFDRLPDDYREVLALARFAQLSHREIAERMGRSEQASRNLLNRAIARLSSEVRSLQAGGSIET